MQEDLKRIARRRIRARIGLYIHATVYVAVNAFLALVQSQTTPQYAWALWPAAGWGLGLAIHAAVVLLGQSRLRERMEADELRKLESR
ncbi:MAG TPA: 2TM domain-containing protein [Burkholderiales bacterium]